MNKHRIALFVVLVAIGFGYFVMIRFQHANAIPPAGTVVAAQGSGLVINGGTAVGGFSAPSEEVQGNLTPTTTGTFIPDDAVDPSLTSDAGASCP